MCRYISADRLVTLQPVMKVRQVVEVLTSTSHGKALRSRLQSRGCGVWGVGCRVWGV